ncbi:putative AdoMet-dependent methyltransferase [Pelagirhabdus alkalitolerans]|uniref:Uncharacterized methyltransferase SAMN05421734_101324 n=1 Tax=Pelagirhabdus alkalitolerans TaxID=1612202 RepID=A0A1G6GNL0_9BACI|nr:class I SAM-dependent methyltransferase [Pelagirhabdus alkalitolerans]SDB83581.1 putative AdoMet-dependent methyltransferase [Pelagirhabdus alkalitolerans]
MGREFVSLFNDWANDYDQAVTGHDQEYQAVFSKYDEILDAVVSASKGFVVEFGVGTGNLTKKLVDAGFTVLGVEPSEAMRVKARSKVPDVSVIDGDFIDFQSPKEQIETFVSSYAFHHLTDEEKQQALLKYHQLLSANGRIVFADTVFTSEEAKQSIIDEAEKQQFWNLAEDLKTEHYPLKPNLENMLEHAGFDYSFEQLNPFVWLITAEKRGG